MIIIIIIIFLKFESASVTPFPCFVAVRAATVNLIILIIN